MSEIKKLIERLCPDGVEWEKLVDNVDVLYGYPFDSRLFCEDETFMPLIRIRDVKPAKASTYYSGEVIEEYRITKGDILVGMDGNFNLEKWNDVDGLLNQRVCKLSSKNEDKILNGFIYHYLKPVFKSIEGELNSGTVIHLSAKRINKIEIPVPPIEVQSKIVEILDNFTELEAELKIKLEAELEARRKQYEYYRNQLLTFDKVGGARFVNMSEIGKFYGGLSGKNKNDFGIGKAKYITYMNVYSNIAVDLSIAEDVNVTDDEKQNSIQYGDIIFTGSSETPEECGMSSVVTENMEEPIYLNSFCFGFRIDDLSVFNVHFLKHLFRSHSLRSQIVKTASGVTRFNVSKKKMENVEVPIPPLSEQKRIASILDRFEALTTDLQSGLPAEIEARRKQYEYYREKLLTFKRKTA
jgi:type I restriction enzyme S subunit